MKVGYILSMYPNPVLSSLAPKDSFYKHILEEKHRPSIRMKKTGRLLVFQEPG